MPKTIIKKRTWRCVECDYGQSFEPTKEAMDFQFNQNTGISLTNVQENECPSCVLQGKREIQMKKVTDPKKKATTTVMGEEDIEPEIIDRDETKHRIVRLGEVDAQIERMDIEGEFATPVKKERIHNLGRNTVEEEIKMLKKEKGSNPEALTFKPVGYFLNSASEVKDYRERRKRDIKNAIVKARLKEDK